MEKKKKKKRYRSDSGRLKAACAAICAAQTLLELSPESFHGLERGETMRRESFISCRFKKKKVLY